MPVILNCDLAQVADYLHSEFHRLWYIRAQRGELAADWRGVRAVKCPLDLWIYQEIITETMPDVIIESGTYCGGSALFMADVCSCLGRGRIITLDITRQAHLPEHDRITYITGSSIDPAIVSGLRAQIGNGERVMVILDSDHAMDHVLAELRQYADFVTPGCYLIVEDTNLNGHPVFPEHGPGPMEAVGVFLKETTAFEVDHQRERFMLTYNPMGYLKRKI